jgi:hypothetical protein
MIRLTDDVKKRIEQSGAKIVDLTAEHLKTIRKFIPTEKPQK